MGWPKIGKLVNSTGNEVYLSHLAYILLDGEQVTWEFECNDALRNKSQKSSNNSKSSSDVFSYTAKTRVSTIL